MRYVAIYDHGVLTSDRLSNAHADEMFGWHIRHCAAVGMTYYSVVPNAVAFTCSSHPVATAVPCVYISKQTEKPEIPREWPVTKP